MSEKSWHDELRNMKSKLDARDNMIERLIEAGEAMEDSIFEIEDSDTVERWDALVAEYRASKTKESDDNTDK